MANNTAILTKTYSFFFRRWSCEGGYREFLIIAVPLILATGMWSVQQFVDRMFLTWHSPEAVAAAMPAGMLNFTIVCMFLGTVTYVDTFVAQYYGAERHKMIGPTVWQGVYISLVGGLVLLAVAPFSRRIFELIGHEAAILQNEVVYFKILCLGSFPALATAALSAFYAGRGKTWTLMWVNIAGTAVNVVLDYCLIFGRWGFPGWGIKGAAVATVLSGCFTFMLLLLLISNRAYKKRYCSLKWQVNWPLLGRILRFGLPNGVNFLVDIAGFTGFILIMGSLGTTSLAATNIAFNINTVAFMPMLGCAIAVSVLVGQYLGRERPEIAARSTYSGFHVTFCYMAAISLLYVFAPSIFILPFAANADPESFEAIRSLVVVLLRFVAVYSLFDTMNLIFASAVKGAGDTHFVMRMMVVLSLAGLVAPSYVAIVLLHKGLYAGWYIASAYIVVLGLAFLFRFLGGKWKSMRVIEPSAPLPL
ncbi:MAG: MATE family efflux transporter [Ammonifex sp.]|jgi:MATE family multidrug resistance protein|nr:MAG: MATE family efflux transporter [Ammonifex sp.]